VRRHLLFPRAPAIFTGPVLHGNSNIVLALTRPVRFDELRCVGFDTDYCSVSWAGAAP
jgi:hypothetical protein